MCSVALPSLTTRFARSSTGLRTRSPRSSPASDRSSMPLRDLLAHVARDEGAVALARSGGDAFCPGALRPFLLAAMLDAVPGAPGQDGPAVVVAPDDRSARDLAGDL